MQTRALHVCLPSPALSCVGAFFMPALGLGATWSKEHHSKKWEGDPMARPDKVAAVAELKDMFTSSQAVVLTEYRGLSVAQL